jgi:hypothetical protein
MRSQLFAFSLVIVAILAYLTHAVDNVDNDEQQSIEAEEKAEEKEEDEEEFIPLLDGLQDSRCSFVFDESKMFQDDVEWQCTQRDRVDHKSQRCRPDYFMFGAREDKALRLLRAKLTTHLQSHRRLVHGKSSSKVSLDYSRHFDERAGQMFVGEANAQSLVSWPRRGVHAARLCNAASMRAIVVLGDPFERCRAHFESRAHVAMAIDSLDVAVNVSAAFDVRVQAFNETQPATADDCHALGDCMCESAFVLHLRRLLDDVPRRNVRIYFSETVMAHTDAVVRDAMAFVGLEPGLWNATCAAALMADGEHHRRNETATDGEGERQEGDAETYDGGGSKNGAARALSHQVFSRALAKRMAHVLDPYTKALESLLGAQTPLTWNLHQPYKIVHLTYGNGKRFEEHARKCSQRALTTGHCDESVVMGLSDVPKSFCEENKAYCMRANGWWTWKPVIALELFERIDDGDVLVYTDSRQYLVGDVRPFVRRMVREGTNMLVFAADPNRPRNLVHDTKRFVLDYFDIALNSTALDYPMAAGHIFIVRKSRDAVDYLTQWRDAMTYDVRMVDNSRTRSEHRKFNRSKNDMAAMSALLAIGYIKHTQCSSKEKFSILQRQR